jgi:hypothetical protein
MPLDGHVFVLGGVDLVKGRHRNTGAVALRIRNELNARLIEQGWPGAAPFEVLSLILRFGEVALPGVDFQKLQTTRGVKMLPVAVQLSMSSIVEAQGAESSIEQVIRPRVLQAINAVAERFGLRGIAA